MVTLYHINNKLTAQHTSKGKYSVASIKPPLVSQDSLFTQRSDRTTPSPTGQQQKGKLEQRRKCRGKEGGSKMGQSHLAMYANITTKAAPDEHSSTTLSHPLQSQGIATGGGFTTVQGVRQALDHDVKKCQPTRPKLIN